MVELLLAAAVVCGRGLLMFVRVCITALQCTYKKKEVKTYFLRGRPNSLFLLLEGHPIPRCHGTPPRDSEELTLGNCWQSSESSESALGPLLACSGRVRLESPGEAESGSAGVQPDQEYPGRPVRRWCIPWRVSSCQGFVVNPPSDTGAMP